MIWLKNDIKGASSSILYGLKGEKVEVVADHGNVKIVKGVYGLFPVPTDELSNELVLPEVKKPEPKSLKSKRK